MIKKKSLWEEQNTFFFIYKKYNKSIVGACLKEKLLIP